MEYLVLVVFTCNVSHYGDSGFGLLLKLNNNKTRNLKIFIKQAFDFFKLYKWLLFKKQKKETKQNIVASMTHTLQHIMQSMSFPCRYCISVTVIGLFEQSHALVTVENANRPFFLL